MIRYVIAVMQEHTNASRDENFATVEASLAVGWVVGLVEVIGWLLLVGTGEFDEGAEVIGAPEDCGAGPTAISQLGPVQVESSQTHSSITHDPCTHTSTHPVGAFEGGMTGAPPPT